MITIFQYPKVLFDLERKIDNLRLELGTLEIERKTIESAASKIVSEQEFQIIDNKSVRRYKTVVARQAAMESECYSHPNYTMILAKIAEKKYELNSTKTLHALRRREFRLLEAENQISGLEYLPSCHIENA